jgi:hypothetical protein
MGGLREAGFCKEWGEGGQWVLKSNDRDIPNIITSGYK